MMIVNVYTNPEKIYGVSSATLMREVIKQYGDWYKLDMPVPTTIGDTRIVHKSRILFLPES